MKYTLPQMRKYISPKAKVLDGKTFGFSYIDRLSTIFVKTAQRIDWHRHDESEILCCLKGSLTYEFRNRPSATLTSGCFMVVPASIEHRLVGGIDGPCRRFSFFIKEPHTRSSGLAPVSAPEMREILALLLKKRLRPHVIGESALLNVYRLANLLDSTQKPDLSAQLTARSDSLAAILTMAGTQGKSSFTNETRMMKEAVNWLQRHFAEQVSVDQLIAYMGYGRSRLFDLFKFHTGLSPIDWLTQFRIEKAKHLLDATEAKVSDIAKACGFADPAFFTRTFHRRTGKSPTEFRKRPLHAHQNVSPGTYCRSTSKAPSQTPFSSQRRIAPAKTWPTRTESFSNIVSLR